MKTKNHTHISSRLLIAFLILVVCCIFLTLPATATGIAQGTYGLTIKNNFVNDDGENLSETYKQIQYLISVSGHFLTAEYNASARSYILTGYTDDSDAATVFSPGKTSDYPAEITIIGLPADTYCLEMVTNAPGYALLIDKVMVTLDPQTAKVNGMEFTYTTRESGDIEYTVVSVTINCARGFPLPLGRSHLRIYDLKTGPSLIYWICLFIVSSGIVLEFFIWRKHWNTNYLILLPLSFPMVSLSTYSLVKSDIISLNYDNVKLISALIYGTIWLSWIIVLVIWQIALMKKPQKNRENPKSNNIALSELEDK